MYIIKDSRHIFLRKAKRLTFAFAISFAVFTLGICSVSLAFESAVTVRLNAQYIAPDYADTDYDGIPDKWELLYGLGPNDPDDTYDDPDKDGIANLEEYRRGTDPTVSESGIVATITATPASGLQPLDVTLTATVDDAHKDDIVKYEWDFDGNGTYDYSSRDPSVAYKYTAPGPNDEGGKRVYYPKLRVINEIGNAGVTTTTINVERNEDISPPIAYPAVVIPPDISTPSKWQFRGDAADDKGIAKYQWDLTGNGEYDFTSTKSGSVIHTYKSTNPGSIYAHFRVTDASGYSEIGTMPVGLDVSEWYEENRNLRPVIEFETEGNNRYVIYKKAGQQVTLRGSATPLGYKITKIDKYGWVKKLEWDFEGDGIYDWVMDENDPEWETTISKGKKTKAKHRYGTPGIYRATLRATTDLEPPHDITITATDHVLVIVEKADGETPPTAVATVKYKGKDVKQINTTLPFNAQFKHSDSEEGSSAIAKYEWDFDGDKKIDYVTTEAKKGKKPKYHYRLPGYYLASLTVTDENGLTDTDYIPVFVSTKPDIYASAITTPEENQTIAGNNVTLTCDVFPDDAGVNTVVFQYKVSEDGGTTWSDWDDIGLGKKISSYMVSWDTNTADVLDGDYLLRAIVNGVDSDNFQPLSVKVDNNFNPNSIPDHIDIYEDDNSGAYTKITKISSDRNSEIVLRNGALIEIPIGAIEGDEIITITENGGGFSAGVGNAIDIEVEGESYTFSKDITITMPYPDGDLGGRDENDLVILWNNNGTWEPLYDSVVYPDENFISAKINHLSSFGIGFVTWGAVLGAGGAAIGEGAVSYCFIATAAYGSADAGDVMILREFRDRFLLTGPLGRRFVDCYYKYSPPIAEYIKDKPILKKITRLALKPLVRFAKWKLKEAKPPSIRGEEDAVQ